MLEPGKVLCPPPKAPLVGFSAILEKKKLFSALAGCDEAALNPQPGRRHSDCFKLFIAGAAISLHSLPVLPPLKDESKAAGGGENASITTSLLHLSEAFYSLR